MVANSDRPTTRLTSWTTRLTAHPWLTTIAVLSVIFVALGSNPLWTQEGRWAVVCRAMLRAGDYVHPTQLGEPYYDKPLASYWFVTLFATLRGVLDERALRLPSALAGLVVIASLCRLGYRLRGRTGATLAAWVALGTGMLVFWARIASADMLNTAAILLAVVWYFEYRERPSFRAYSVFFAIIAVGCHFKGPVAAALTVVAMLPDLLTGGRWRRHLRWSLVAGALVGLGVFFGILFAAGDESAREQLAMMVRENFTRYVDAFDHDDPPWTYLGYLPAYLLPWTFFLPWIVARVVRERRELDDIAKWPAIAIVALFVFLTASSSRRSYYLLPIVPLVVPLVVDWALAHGIGTRRHRVVAGTAITVALLFVTWNVAVVPTLEHYGGLRSFGAEVRERASQIRPWDDWNVIICGAPPRTAFYVDPRGTATQPYGIDDIEALRRHIASHPHTIVLMRRKYFDRIGYVTPGEIIVEERPRVPDWLDRFVKRRRLNLALIPAPSTTATSAPPAPVEHDR